MEQLERFVIQPRITYLLPKQAAHFTLNSTEVNTLFRLFFEVFRFLKRTGNSLKNKGFLSSHRVSDWVRAAHYRVRWRRQHLFAILFLLAFTDRFCGVFSCLPHKHRILHSGAPAS